MKNLKYIILAATAISLTSCGIFGKYQPETTVPDNLFGTGENVEQLSSQPSIGELSWRDFFTDENLRELIDTALVRNTDLEVARWRRQMPLLRRQNSATFRHCLSRRLSISLRAILMSFR